MSENAKPPTEPVALPSPEEQTASRLARIEHWIARQAHVTANHSAQFDQFAKGSREDIGQLLGGLLLVDGTTARVERNLLAMARHLGIEIERGTAAAGGDSLLAPKREPTDQFDLPGGVGVVVAKSTTRKWGNVLKVAKVIGVVVAVVGWMWHAWRIFSPLLAR